MRLRLVILVMILSTLLLSPVAAGLAWSQSSVGGAVVSWLPMFLGAPNGEVLPSTSARFLKFDKRPIYGGNRRETASDDARAELRVIVISDMNGRYGSAEYGEDVHAAVREIIDRRPDLVISTGDMVAGQREGLDYRAMWQGFHQSVTVPLRDAGIPLLITPGNHDGATSPRFAYERSIFRDEWDLHRPKVRFVDDSDYPVRYSAVMGETFFISLDATSVGALPSEQMRWLERQLASAQGYENRIVFGHVPLYAVSDSKATEVIGDAALEALFNRMRVSAYISGHHHTYYPGARGRLRLISMPCLGSGLRRLIAPNQERGARAFVEFVVARGGLYDVEAWRSPRFESRIEREDLPPKVGLAQGVLVRDDLLGLDLRSRPLPPKECGPRVEGAYCESPVTPDPRSPSLPLLPDGLGR